MPQRWRLVCCSRRRFRFTNTSSGFACKRGSGNQPRESRKAQVEVRATTVTLRPPWRAEGQLPAVSVDVVLVCEIDLPVDDVPVEWLLLTTHPIDDMELVRRIVQYYSVRFII